MVSHPEILEAALAGRICHCLERFSPVRRVGVTMQDSVQIAVRHQFRQSSLQRPLDLTTSLAQFRLDEGKSESIIDVLFIRSQQAAALPKPVQFELHALAFSESA